MKPPNMAPVYVQLWEQASVVAREAGYCLAIHGTMARDLDLLACPWTEDAVAPDELVRRIADKLAWLLRSDDGVEPKIVGPEPKPHRRLAWSIPYMAHWQIDLSVMPRREPESEAAGA